MSGSFDPKTSANQLVLHVEITAFQLTTAVDPPRKFLARDGSTAQFERLTTETKNDVGILRIGDVNRRRLLAAMLHAAVPLAPGCDSALLKSMHRAIAGSRPAVVA